MENKRWRGPLAAIVLVATSVACSPNHEERPANLLLSVEGMASRGGEAGEEGRAVIGRGPDYTPINEPSSALFSRLEGSMADRRQVAWGIVEAMLQPQSLTFDGNTYEVPMWHTWFEGRGVNPEIQNLFTEYVGAFRACRENPQCDDTPDEIARRVVNEAGDKDLVRSLTTANLENVLPQSEEDETNGAPERELAQGVTLFSPAFVEHILANARGIEECQNTQANHTRWNDPPPSATQFSRCIPEFPRSAVMVKTSWEPVINGQIASGDFDAAAVPNIVGRGVWPAAAAATVSPSNIYMVRSEEGQDFALNSIHFSTKDVREWIWVSLWWSPNPNTDFGQDRPASIARYNGGVWANYKMCVTSSFEEGDDDPGLSYETGRPSLARMLREFDGAIEREANGARTTTWCSNPNIERQTSNARTNCIGCHQYAYTWHEPGNRAVRFSDTIAMRPSTTSPGAFEQVFPTDYPQYGRARRRTNFPAEFSWAFAGEFRGEITEARRVNGQFQW